MAYPTYDDIKRATIMDAARRLLAEEPPKFDPAADREELAAHEAAIHQFVWEWRGGARYVIGELLTHIERLVAEREDAS